MVFHYPRMGCGGNVSRRETPDIPLPSNTLSLLLGDSKVIPGQTECLISQAGSGSGLRSPSSAKCLENLLREGPRRHHNPTFEQPQDSPLYAGSSSPYVYGWTQPHCEGSTFLLWSFSTYNHKCGSNLERRCINWVLPFSFAFSFPQQTEAMH